jgi:hypothetical protein
MTQERHGLGAIARNMQLDAPVCPSERFLCQPHIAGIVVDQQHVDGSTVRVDNRHELYSSSGYDRE